MCIYNIYIEHIQRDDQAKSIHHLTLMTGVHINDALAIG